MILKWTFAITACLWSLSFAEAQVTPPESLEEARTRWKEFYKNCFLGIEPLSRHNTEQAAVDLQYILAHQGVFCVVNRGDLGQMRLEIVPASKLKVRREKNTGFRESLPDGADLENPHPICIVADRFIQDPGVRATLCYRFSWVVFRARGDFSDYVANDQNESGFLKQVMLSRDFLDIDRLPQIATPKKMDEFLAFSPGFQFALFQYEFHSRRIKEIGSKDAKTSPFDMALNGGELCRIPATRQALKTILKAVEAKRMTQKEALEQLRFYVAVGKMDGKRFLEELAILKKLVEADSDNFEIDESWDNLVWAEIDEEEVSAEIYYPSHRRDLIEASPKDQQKELGTRIQEAVKAIQEHQTLIDDLNGILESNSSGAQKLKQSLAKLKDK